jgi:uncharacterized membrane protein (UPF0127 family)
MHWGLKNRKSRETYCVFNKTRESFLSLRVAPADTSLARLKGLAGRLRLKADEGIWVLPSQGIHTIGVLFSIDLLYLDASYRVVHLVESFGSFRIGPLRMNCASVLEMPTRTIYTSQTEVGDQLLIYPPDKMQEYLRESQTKVTRAVASP